MKLLEELNSILVQTLQLILLFYGQKSEQKDISIFRITKYNAKQRVVAKIKIKKWSSPQNYKRAPGKSRQTAFDLFKLHETHIATLQPMMANEKYL